MTLFSPSTAFLPVSEFTGRSMSDGIGPAQRSKPSMRLEAAKYTHLCYMIAMRHTVNLPTPANPCQPTNSESGIADVMFTVEPEQIFD